MIGQQHGGKHFGTARKAEKGESPLSLDKIY